MNAVDKTDIILALSHTPTEDYMAQMVARTKTHEFRKLRYPDTVRRMWFYETAPVSAITHVCEFVLGSARPAASEPTTAWHLPTGGIGNAEFNSYHLDWEGYNFAYEIKSCTRLRVPVTLATLKEEYGFKSAPRGMAYVPSQLKADVQLDEQERLW